MISDLLNEIISHGDRGAVVPFSRVNDIKQDMIELQNGMFHTEWLKRMAKHITDDANKFIPSDITFEPRSLISVIIPSPKAMLQFIYHGGSFNCAVPPHYTNWNKHNIRVQQYLSDYLSPYGFSATRAATFPHKLLAVHCGLGLYGRNNICYNNEFGSYMQIMTYISDAHCDETAWYPLGRMESCDECRACVNACPTSAINPNYRLVDSDRCLTFFNESANAFPDWLDNAAHNSITGCTKCQDCCPGNAHNKNNIITGAIFTEKETIEILSNKGDSPYSESVAAKLDSTGIFQDYTDPSVLPRNLSVLLQHAQSK